jgi:POT family proton-dependent oligopeptide transporter
MSEVVKSGHPSGLYVLFMAEMWERFCYYGMRVILSLYMIQSLMMGDKEAFAIYGAYTALVYAAPVLGGRIADSLLGYRNAVVLGGILMAIGEFMILGGTELWLYAGMGCIIVGNGYFKANISTIVGNLYPEGDPRRDSGFTIFYMGINIGALLATTVVAWVGSAYGFHWGFALAGFGMLLGIFFFINGEGKFREEAAPKDPEKLKKKVAGPFNWYWVTIIGSVLVMPLLFLLIRYNTYLDYLLYAVFIAVCISLLMAGSKDGKVALERMIALIIFMVINIVFWMSFEQAGTSLTLFAERNVDRDIFGWEMPAAMTQFFNPAFIILLAAPFSMMWIRLTQIGRNPSIPMKFALGILQVGLGFLVVQLGVALAGPEYLVPLWILLFLYMLHTTGELCLSPIGLSMVTKLAPSGKVGTAMGAWFLSFAMSNLMAGKIAQLTGGGEGGGEEVVVDAAATLAQYTEVFTYIGLFAVGFAILVAILSKPLNKLMHGVV